MITQPDGFLRKVSTIAKGTGSISYTDEVATGFGRTGTMFACEQEGIEPDFLCLAKGITRGYLPLAATVTTQEIFDGFLGRFDEFKTFFHATPIRETHCLRRRRREPRPLRKGADDRAHGGQDNPPSGGAETLW
jgi:4-aminobutyrate aminotransferase-like enzyme